MGVSLKLDVVHTDIRFSQRRCGKNCAGELFAHIVLPPLRKERLQPLPPTLPLRRAKMAPKALARDDLAWSAG
jgi:hypothetical protein